MTRVNLDNGRPLGRDRRERVLILENEAGTHVVEVSPVLNQWAVTVRAKAGGPVICDDYFSQRWQAVARGEDFLRLLNRSEAPPGWTVGGRGAAEQD